MSKKKKKSVPVPQPKQEKKMIINMTKVELAKAYEVPAFRTGKHMTEKDRPRKKNWKREYERRGSGKYGEYGTDSFLLQKLGEKIAKYTKKGPRELYDRCRSVRIMGPSQAFLNSKIWAR